MPKWMYVWGLIAGILMLAAAYSTYASGLILSKDGTAEGPGPRFYGHIAVFTCIGGFLIGYSAWALIVGRHRIAWAQSQQPRFP